MLAARGMGENAEKFKDLVARWKEDFSKWGTKRVIETFDRCLDYPSRRAAVEVLAERLEGDIPESDKAAINAFFGREDVKKFVEGLAWTRPE
jgi:hypothetical protein